MTKQEFLSLRPRHNWMYCHALTQSGYYVCGVKREQDPILNQRVIAGRLQVIKNNPFYDEYVAWNINGVALDHDYGNLDMETV